MQLSNEEIEKELAILEMDPQVAWATLRSPDRSAEEKADAMYALSSHEECAEELAVWIADRMDEGRVDPEQHDDLIITAMDLQIRDETTRNRIAQRMHETALALRLDPSADIDIISTALLRYYSLVGGPSVPHLEPFLEPDGNYKILVRALDGVFQCHLCDPETPTIPSLRKKIIDIFEITIRRAEEYTPENNVLCAQAFLALALQDPTDIESFIAPLQGKTLAGARSLIRNELKEGIERRIKRNRGTVTELQEKLTRLG